MANEYDDLIANQPVAANEYDDLVLDMAKQQRGQFVGAGLQARQFSPDQHAEALSLGRAAGVPPAVALTNRDDLLAQQEAERVDRLMKESPIVARWASVPENMGVAQDDLDGLSMLERVFTASMYPMVGLIGQGAAVATGATDYVSKPLAGAARRVPGIFGSIVGGIHDIAEPAGDWLELTTGLSGIPDREIIEGDQLEPLTRLSSWLRSFEGAGYDPMVRWDDVKSNPLLAPGFIVEQGVVSAPDMAAAITMLPAYVLGRTEEIAQRRAENNGRPGEVTLGDMGAAAPAAIIEAVLERITTKYLLKGGSRAAVTPKDVAARVATQTGVQGVTGGVEELAAYLGETVGTERGARGSEALDTFMAGALVEAGIGAGFEYAKAVTERARLIERSVADQVRLQAVTEAAATLKTGDRSPDAVEALVKQMIDAGQSVTDTVYLDLERARTFFQEQGLDPIAELTVLAGGPEAMAEATATGDLRIPLSRWLARAAKRPDVRDLSKFARLDPERLSPAEIEELDIDAILQEVLQDQSAERGAAAADRAEASAAGPDPVQQVRDDIVGQLIGAGVEKSAAEAQADVLAQRYATRAARRGKGETAAEVFALSGLEIVRETPALQALRAKVPEIDTVIDPLIDAVRTGRVPTQRDIYGPSLVTALIRAGGVQDSGGELRSRDARLARPGLVSRNGMTFDDALQFARENGYLPPAAEDAPDALDVNAIIDLIDQELRGDPVFAVGNMNARAMGFAEAVDQIDAELRSRGLDVATMSNAEIKEALGVVGGGGAHKSALGVAIEFSSRSGSGRVTYTRRSDGRLERLIVYDDGESFFATLSTDKNGDELWVSQDTYESGEYYPSQFSEEDAESKAIDDAIYIGADKSIGAAGGNVGRAFDQAQVLGSVANPLPEGDLQSAPVGAWVRGPSLPGVDPFVLQVRDVPLDQIDATELQTDGDLVPEKRRDGLAYAERMRAGETGYPNAKGSELPNGKIKLQDGHRRFWALRKTGASSIRVAVDPIKQPRTLFQPAAADVFDWTPSPRIRRAKVGDTSISYTVGEDVAKVVLVRTPPEARGRGGARAAMQQFLQEADARGLPVELTVAEQDSKTDPAKLEAFYQSLGFVATGEEVDGSPRMRRDARGDAVRAELDEGTGLPLNPDGTVTVYHHTSASAAAAIKRTGRLKSMGEPDVYVTTRRETDTGYGDTAVAIRVKPDLLLLDDEFPDGRRDFRIDTGSPGGSVSVVVGEAPRILNQRTAPTVTRGRIEFRPAGGARIVLNENANLSTFLHETGHLWLEELITDATTDGTDPQLAADLDRVLQWMGLDVRAADGADVVRTAVQSDQHEQWARGFEAYLREGRAPSANLRETFARFRAWLVRLYRDIKSLNVTLSDDVRAVMDRLIATDEEIARAQVQNLQAAIAASPEEAAELGMSPREFTDYAEARDRATREAREEIEQELIAAWERQAREEYQRERERMRDTVEDEVNRQPVYRAILALQAAQDDGGIRLDKRDLVERYGEAFLKRLPGPGRERNSGRYVYALTGGLSIDEAALLLGFESGDAMVQAMVNAPDRVKTIEATTDDRIREFYPDPLTDGSIAERARKAVHSGARMEVMDRELRLLAKAAGAKPYQARTIRAVAERMIGRRSIRSLRPNEYLVSERKAGREAMAAMAAKQFDIAYRARFKQALNAQLYRLATDAQDEVGKAQQYLRRFDKRKLREKIGKAGNGWLEAIDSILDDYDLRTVSGAEIDRAAAKRQILEAADAGLIDLPDAVRQNLESARRTNWRELSVDDMRGLVDTIKNIETVAIREWRMIVDGEIRMIEDDAQAIAESVTAAGDYVEPNLGSKSKAELMARWGKDALAIWLRPAAIARQADGGAERGAVTRLIIEPMRRAVSEKLEPMKAKARDDLAALYQKHYTKKELLTMSTRRTKVQGIGQSWTKFDLLALALNWGNEANRQAVLESRANGRQVFTENGVKQALSTLTAKDWRFVQDVWDYVNSYWPEIAAAQKRRTGLEPAKVEAKPFTIISADGPVELRGGYYPLKYDSGTDANVKADDLEDAFQRIRMGRNGKAATARGHTIERVGSGRRPVRMDINVLHEHVSSVIHDLALGDVVDYVYKVLNNGATKAAFSETAKLEDWKSLNTWLKDAAAGEMAARSFADKAFRYIRIGFTKSKLGFNIVTALLQPTGFAQTAVVVGKRAMIRGALAFSSSPVKAYRQVMDASAFMRTRYELNAWNKDVQDTMDALRGKAGLLPSWIGPAMFLPIAKTQQVVDTVTWLAAYNKATEAGEAHGDAVSYADGVVENAQTSGFFSDRSAIERGTLSDTTRQSEFVRAWTALASYMIAKGNIAFERVRGTDYRSPVQVANLIGDLMLLFTVEAVLAGVIRGTLPEDDDDWWWWLAGSSAESVAATVPFIREVPSAVKGFAVGGGPVGTLLNDIGKTWTQLQQGEVDASLIKAANNVGGTLFHYPSAQMNRAIDAYWRENVENEDVAPIEYITGRREPR